MDNTTTKERRKLRKLILDNKKLASTSPSSNIQSASTSLNITPIPRCKFIFLKFSYHLLILFDIIKL
jgi:hypothetical protein